MSRPDENVDWAEGAGAQVSEPANERAGGFPFRYVPPAEQINWMWRAVGRWIRWLRDKSDNHVHDGEGGEFSAPKVDLENHIDYRGNATLEPQWFGPAVHRIMHANHNPGGTAEFESDTLIGRRVHTDYVLLEDENVPLRIQTPGANPQLRPVRVRVEGEVEATGAVKTDTLASGHVAVEDPNFGGYGDLTAKTLHAVNTPKALLRANSGGDEIAAYNIASVTYPSTGTYVVSFTDDIPMSESSRLVVVATPSDVVVPVLVSAQVVSVGSSRAGVMITTFNGETGVAMDNAFSAVFYW